MLPLTILQLEDRLLFRFQLHYLRHQYDLRQKFQFQELEVDLIYNYLQLTINRRLQ